MDQILEECQGCIGTADDITVHGCTEAAEHNGHLQNIMQIAHKYDLVFNPQKHTHEGSSCQFLWLPLWCWWCPPRLGKGWCHTCLTGTNKCHQTPRVLRPSHIPQSLYSWLVHLDCPPVWAAQEGHRLHLEPHLWCHFSTCQRSCCQWHHPQVLQPFTSHDNTSWCLTGRSWCSTPAKQQTCGFCQQGPYQNQMPVC